MSSSFVVFMDRVIIPRSLGFFHPRPLRIFFKVSVQRIRLFFRPGRPLCSLRSIASLHYLPTPRLVYSIGFPSDERYFFFFFILYHCLF